MVWGSKGSKANVGSVFQEDHGHASATRGGEERNAEMFGIFPSVLPGVVFRVSFLVSFGGVGSRRPRTRGHHSS